jgi:hypothetical protein
MIVLFVAYFADKYLEYSSNTFVADDATVEDMAKKWIIDEVGRYLPEDIQKLLKDAYFYDTVELIEQNSSIKILIEDYEHS